MIDNADMTCCADMLCEADEFIVVTVKRNNGQCSFKHLVSDVLLLPFFTDYVGAAYEQSFKFTDKEIEDDQ